VFQAVFGLVQNLTQFKVVTRRYTRSSSVEAINTPMLMSWEQPEKTEGGERGLRKRWWEVWYIIVCYNNDQYVAGATILNPLIDAVEKAIREPDNPVHQTQTLGAWCRGATSTARRSRRSPTSMSTTARAAR